MFALGVLITVSAISVLFVVTVYGLCSKKKPAINENMDEAPKGVVNVATPSKDLGLGAPPRDQVPSYKVFMEQAAETGVMNDREAPETFKNDGTTFDKRSVNFSNFGDFRKDNIKNSTKIQNTAANNKGASGIISPLVESDEYDSEYDTESEEEEEASAPPPVATSTDNSSNPTLGPKKAMEDDFSAGISKFNPNAQPRGVNRAQVPANLIQSLSFTKETVDDRLAEMNGPGATDSMRTKRKTRKKVRRKKKKEGDGGMTEVQRKKVRRRKKKETTDGDMNV